MAYPDPDKMTQKRNHDPSCKKGTQIYCTVYTVVTVHCTLFFILTILYIVHTVCTVGWVNLYKKFEIEKYTVYGKLILLK